MYSSTKLEILQKVTIPRESPYFIKTVHDNGTVTISKGIAVTDRVNIWRLQPHFEHTDDE